MEAKREENFPIRISMGWVLMLLILTMVLIVMIMHSIVVVGNFNDLQKDPGRYGMNLIISVLGFYAVMPLFIYIAEKTRIRALRWMMVVFASIFLLFFALHHLSHWQFGDRPDVFSHILEMAHHAIAIWVIYLSVRWARAPQAIPA